MPVDGTDRRLSRRQPVGKLVVTAMLAAATLAGVSQALADDAWLRGEGHAPDLQPLPGWQCVGQLALPAASPPSGESLVVCRRSGAGSSGRLSLLHIGPAGSRVLGGLGDASRTGLVLFTPSAACGGRDCLAGVVLLDLRDESSCHGTQVLKLRPGRPPQRVGYINEVQAEEGAEVCVGARIGVQGTAAVALLQLPEPLLVPGRDGTARPLPDGVVRYTVRAQSGKLERTPAP